MSLWTFARAGAGLDSTVTYDAVLADLTVLMV